MGKRRDRRQQQAASRRMKLDLSMDDVLPPSETPGSLENLDSALGEDVKADDKNQEVANENPLSLLGQYSDDEADEEDDSGAGFFHDVDNEAKKDTLKCEDEQKDIAQNQVSDNLSLEKKENRSTNIDDNNEQTSKDILISDTRVQEAIVKNEWQPVLDDHSGEYYYWNVRTGETTWVKPVESGSADEPAVQPVDFDACAGRSPEQSLVQMDTKVECRESSDGGKKSPSESDDIQHPEKAIICLESTEAELNNSNADSVLGKKDLAGDASAATEKLDDDKDPESMAGSISFMHERVDHEGEDRKEEEGGKNEEESMPEIDCNGKDLNIENAIEGAPDKISQKIETEISSRSSPTVVEGMHTGQITPGDAQVVSECTRNLMPSEQTRTIQEKMASLVEKAESLHNRLNVLARESCGGVSRHALLASQTEARLTDWKAFCALGFSPEACLSFIQRELTQLELVLTADEANELERQKLIGSTSTLEASHEVRSEVTDSAWSLNWTYYQHNNNAILEPWKQGQPTKITRNSDDVGEGELLTSYAEIYPAYGGVSDGQTAVNTQKVSNDTGTEDVDMDVDMEVDDEVEVEPAVPGISSDVPSHEVAVAYSYPCPLPGSSDVGIVAPLDSTCVGEPTSYFHTGISGDSWAPPLPPDDEWAPPPPGESEPAPPPPPDEPPPLPPQSPEVISLPSMSSEVQLQYFVPEYSLENNPLPHCVAVADYQPVVDSSVYGSYVEGVVYSNSSQSTETLKIEQPYVVASASTPAFNGWTAPVVAPTASLLVNPMFLEAPVKTISYASSAPTAVSMAADSNVLGASLEAKKLGKGKTKKRTHAVAAAPMLNKKVSSLVNKWKQAKEELHGGEDEDEDKALFDVEVLEKKRQKEIEEWRRQQIASGEALDNVNFQPLGTLDWRERVKRARKADSKEGKEGTTSAVVASSNVEGQDVEALKSKKPNLTDLSKGLPAGWQAYWDEASGEVYYGNLITQETTWDKPVT